MPYADYAYYKSEYLGDAVTEEDFPRLAKRAGEYVDAMTGYQAAAYARERDPSPIRNAVCAIAEVIQQIEQESSFYGGNASVDGMRIETEITGRHHVTYAKRMNTTSKQGQDAIDRAILRTAIPHLYPTGLLYRGVGLC